MPRFLVAFYNSIMFQPKFHDTWMLEFSPNEKAVQEFVWNISPCWQFDGESNHTSQTKKHQVGTFIFLMKKTFLKKGKFKQALPQCQFLMPKLVFAYLFFETFAFQIKEAPREIYLIRLSHFLWLLPKGQAAPWVIAKVWHL